MSSSLVGLCAKPIGIFFQSLRTWWDPWYESNQQFFQPISSTCRKSSVEWHWAEFIKDLHLKVQQAWPWPIISIKNQHLHRNNHNFAHPKRAGREKVLFISSFSYLLPRFSFQNTSDIYWASPSSPHHQDCTVAREKQGRRVSLSPDLLWKVLVALGDAAPGQGTVRLSWKIYGFF